MSTCVILIIMMGCERFIYNYVKWLLAYLPPPSTTTAAVLGGMGRLPSYLARYYRMVCYWLKVTNAVEILGDANYDLCFHMSLEGNQELVGSSACKES